METVSISAGRELFYEVRNPDARETVILLHGLGSSHLYWSSALSFAELAAHRLILVDLHGHGKSPLAAKTQDDDKKLSIDGFADDLVLLMDKLGIARTALVGHSMSGLVVTTFAAKYSNRVTKLVLLGAIKTLPEAGKQAMLERATKARSGQLASVALSVSHGAISAKSRSKPLVAELIRALIEGTDPEAYAKACEAIVEANEPELERIKAQTLVIGGQEDYMANEETVDYYVSKIKGARKHMMQGIGHWQAVEDPHFVGELLGMFLQ